MSQRSRFYGGVRMVNPKEFNLLSEHEVAKRCGVSRITLLRMRKAGRIRFYRIGTRILFSQAQIEESLARVEEGKESCEEGHELLTECRMNILWEFFVCCPPLFREQ